MWIPFRSAFSSIIKSISSLGGIRPDLPDRTLPDSTLTRTTMANGENIPIFILVVLPDYPGNIFHSYAELACDPSASIYSLASSVLYSLKIDQSHGGRLIGEENVTFYTVRHYQVQASLDKSHTKLHRAFLKIWQANKLWRKRDTQRFRELSEKQHILTIGSPQYYNQLNQTLRSFAAESERGEEVPVKLIAIGMMQYSRSNCSPILWHETFAVFVSEALAQSLSGSEFLAGVFNCTWIAYCPARALFAYFLCRTW